MGWRETWRATVESFLREVRDPSAPARADTQDPLVAAIAAARLEIAALEQELEAVGARAVREADAADACARRQELASRIGDGETAGIAERFSQSHRARADVLRRKHEVLKDEVSIARAALNDLLDLARAGSGRG